MQDLETTIIATAVEKLNKVYDEYVVKLNNASKRTDVSIQDLDLSYSVRLCVRMLLEVCNKKYYPNITDKQLTHILTNLTVSIVSNVYYPYVIDNRFIHKLQAQIAKQLDAYYVDECLLYINTDSSNIFNQMINYLNDLFVNCL